MTRHLRILFASSFFFSAHIAILAYTNSSSLSRFASDSTISFIYAGSSALSLLWLAIAPTLLRRYGNWKLAIGTFGVAIVTLLFLATAAAPVFFAALFAFYFSLNILITYVLDIFIEHYSTNSGTGNIRGIYLTSVNLAWVGAPIIAGLLIFNYGFSAIYGVAALLLIPAALLIASSEHGFRDQIYKPARFFRSLSVLKTNKSVRLIIFLNFLLQFFYAWMVIYAPLYLTKVHGFSWETIGILFTFMLLPFIIFQYPAGKIADKILGEKELLVAGFLIMCLATIFFALLPGGSVLAFGIALFTTRVGASIVEVMCDTYFFKQITDKETTFISFYRETIPLAYIIAPLWGVLVLASGSYNLLFFILGALMLVGAGFSLTLKDTR
ncbi:MAG TPA: MFS transporter [Candidatus Paceibacterota bacterium]|nr:MFS transporter [Candidatus Paceibacterota bacterium]